MDIAVHRRLDAGVTGQLLQNLRLHSTFNSPCRIGVAECVHTESLDPRLITQFIQVGIVGTVLRGFPCPPVNKDEILHDKACLSARSPVNVL